MSDLKAAEQFLKNKGIDTEKYVIHDINGGYLPQIPIASWLTEFAEQQANVLPTGERQSNIPDVIKSEAAVCPACGSSNFVFTFKPFYSKCFNCGVERQTLL